MTRSTEAQDIAVQYLPEPIPATFTGEMSSDKAVDVAVHSVASWSLVDRKTTREVVQGPNGSPQSSADYLPDDAPEQPVIPFPKPPSTSISTFTALQEWEGYVIEIHSDHFLARLVDLTAKSSQEKEEASIPLVELSDDDVEKIRPGSVFRWVIGYERSISRTKRRVSQIVFRDLPTITKTDLIDGSKWATDVIQTFRQ